MAQATESSVSAILKEVYPGEIEDELNNEVAIWAIVQKEQISGAQGKHFIRPMRIQRAQGIGARPDNTTLPIAGSQGYVDATINVSSNYFKGQITGRTIRTSYDSDAAFMQALQAEMTFGMTDYISDMGRQLYNGAGQLTTVNGAVSASTTVVVADSSYLGVGEYLEFWKTDGTNETTNDSSLPSGATGTAIVSITGNTVVVTTAQTLTTLDTVARAGNNTGFVTTNELVGLDVIVDDLTDYSGKTYFGLSRSTYPILKGNRLDISSGSAVPGDSTTALDENKLQYGVDLARKVGGGKVDLFLSDFTSARLYANLLSGLKRYPMEGITAPSYSGGFKQSEDLRTNAGYGLSFSGITFVPSRLSPAKKIFGIDTSCYKVFQQSEVEWLMNGDSVLFPLQNAAPSIDAYMFGMYYDAQFYCEAPNRSVKFVNVQ